MKMKARTRCEGDTGDFFFRCCYISPFFSIIPWMFIYGRLEEEKEKPIGPSNQGGEIEKKKHETRTWVLRTPATTGQPGFTSGV